MTKIGYKQSEAHKHKISLKALMRGNNGWYGRKHSAEAVAKMRRPKSAAHKYKMSQSAIRRWNKNPQGVWLIPPRHQKVIVQSEPVAPMYRDIFMDNYIVDSEGGIWKEVD